MFRTSVFPFVALAVALLSTPASANEYFYGGYAPYPPPAYGPTPYVGYAPPPAYSQPRLPPPPALNLSEGPRYYRYSGYGAAAAPCYDQYVRIPDSHGGWAWGLKSGCDQR